MPINIFYDVMGIHFSCFKDRLRYNRSGNIIHLYGDLYFVMDGVRVPCLFKSLRHYFVPRFKHEDIS